MTLDDVVYSVAVYLVDRAYGGPEEGGWWYDTGELVIQPGLPLPRFTEDENEARRWQEEMMLPIAKENEGRYDLGSVLSQGQYSVVIHENELPSSFPKERPHYE